jgi:hypothetical protein
MEEEHCCFNRIEISGEVIVMLSCCQVVTLFTKLILGPIS